MGIGGETRRKASLPETIGAWLRIWTPPRDVEVPPIPVRGLLIGAAVVLVLGAGATALIAPAIDESKERRSAAEARELAQRREARRREQIAEQRPRRLDASALRAGAGATEPERLEARASLLRRAETAISADARARADAGELQGNPRGTECEPYPKRTPGPEADLETRRGVYDCLVFVRAVPKTETSIGGQVGYPFRAVLDFERFSVTWCKTNPIPGERVVPDPRTVVELPKPCRADAPR